MKKNAGIVATLGVMSAFAAILSYVEMLVSFDIWIPGAKLGLANIAIVIALYLYGWKAAIGVNVVRIMVVGLLFGNWFSIAFSLAGAFVSFTVMVISKKSKQFSCVGVSVAGGVSHNVGQMIVAIFVIESISVVYYVPALIIIGVITGVLNGFISMIIIKRITGLITSR